MSIMTRADERGEKSRLLHLRVQRATEVSVLSLAGDLDIANCDAVRSTVDELVREDVGRVIIDLSALSFTDSTGLGALVRAHKQAHAGGVDFAIVCPQGRVRELFAITGLIDVLHVVETTEDAGIIDGDLVRPPRERR